MEWMGVESWALCGLHVVGYPLDLGIGPSDARDSESLGQPVGPHEWILAIVEFVSWQVLSQKNKTEVMN
jgi:hypothetical protein